jgi:hypothetical protein
MIPENRKHPQPLGMVEIPLPTPDQKNIKAVRRKYLHFCGYLH